MSGTGLQALLAAAPVLVVLVLMTAAGWSAARAGLVTAVVTLVLAVTAFGFGGAADPFTAWSGSAGVLAEASFIALTVIGIIGPALGIHHLQQRTGAALRLRSGLARLHPDPRLGALLVAWFFALVLVRRRGRVRAGPGAATPAATPAALRAVPGAEPVEGRELPMVLAAAPNLVLVALVLVTRLVPPLRDALRGVVLEWGTGTGFSGSVQPLFHPAVLLTAAFVVGALLQRAPGRDVLGAFVAATRQLGPVLVALVAMVTIARTMSHAGMTDELAYTAAGAGAAWPLVAPAVGAFGTFVTGSATASNVLFTELQATTAEAVGLPVLPLLGAQGFGAAVGNLICPHNIVAAVATVGLTGQEGRVLRSTFPTAMVYVVLGGVLALLLAR